MPEGAHVGSLDILLVDDDNDIRRVAQLALERVGGHRVRLAESGQRAIELAHEQLPDVILLDVMMPHFDGPSVLLALRAEPAMRDVPVLFMTAKVQKQESERFLSLGAAGIVAKPFDPMLLAKSVEGLLAAWRMRRG